MWAKLTTSESAQIITFHVAGMDLGQIFSTFMFTNVQKNIKQFLEKKPYIQYEPYFKLYIFMKLRDYSALRSHERRLHLQGHDTINNPNSLDN